MPTNQNSNKFRGGLRVGLWCNSWPNGSLEINQNALILRDEVLKKDYQFSKNEGVQIEIKKVFPVIGSGVQLLHKNQNYDKKIIFWYWGFRFNELTEVLKKCGWLNNC